jgi:hypothetical protein
MLRNFKISLDQPTNHQAFYSQASWGRSGKKPHEPKKTGTKQKQKRSGVKTKDDKKPNRKRRKGKAIKH